MTKFFGFFFVSKNSLSYVDIEPSNLKAELARDNIIPNNCVKTKLLVCFLLLLFFFL